MRKSLVTLVMLLPVSSSFAAPNHCSRAEEIIFSCSVEDGPKVVSLCASTRLSAKAGTLYYRFGPPSRPELEYPAKPNGAARKFKHAKYSRTDVIRTEVTFQRGDTTYGVFDYDEKFDGKRMRSRGVRATVGNVEIVRQCTGAVISKLSLMEGKIPCDAESALGQCEKPAF